MTLSRQVFGKIGRGLSLLAVLLVVANAESTRALSADAAANAEDAAVFSDEPAAPSAFDRKAAPQSDALPKADDKNKPAPTPAELEEELAPSKKTTDLPELKSYTKTAMAVYQGDKVDMRVEALGNGLRYRWVKEDKTICTAKNCQLDTKGWGLGKHLLVLVVYNSAGSRSVKYTVYILAASPDMEPRTLTPELMSPAEQPGGVKEDDMFVQSITGAGYTYTKQDVQVIGRQRRPLVWDEKVRTTASGVLVLARSGREEHFVLPSTLVLLDKAESDRRVLALQYGALRSRTIQDNEPVWSTTVGSWLQVDASSQSDVVVAKAGMEANDPVEVSVLRGFARVVVQPPSEDPSKVLAAKEVVVPAGTMIRVTRNGEVSNPLLPNPKILGPYVRRSTPHYLPKKPKMKALEFAHQSWALPDAARTASANNLLAQVDKYLEERDPLAALELLLPSIDKSKGNYDLALRFGLTYQGMHLHKEAFGFYKEASAAKPKDFRVHYQTGLMYMQSQNWKQAVRYFNLAEKYSQGTEDLQALHYYRGVAEFWLERNHGARGDFNFAVWEGTDSAIAESARIFLSKLEMKKWWGVYARGGAVYDGNPMRLSADADAPEGMQKTGMAYLGAFGLFVNAFHTEASSLKVGFDFKKLGFLGDMADVSLLDESLYLDARVGFGGTEGKPFFEIGLKPYVQLIFVGEERADDIMGAELMTRFGGVMWQPELKIQSRLHQDPLPARDDLLDPLTLEPVVASERSKHQSILALGVTPIDSYPNKLGLDLNYESVTYRNQYLKGDSFTTIGLDTKYTYFWSPRSVLMPTLTYGIRNYADSIDSRKDNRLGLMVDWRWYYYSALYQDLWLSYMSQSSSRSESAYSRMELGLTATWEL